MGNSVFRHSRRQIFAERSKPGARFLSENFIAKDAAGITAGNGHFIADDFWEGTYPVAPSLVLNSPSDGATTSDQTPTLDFTGTEQFGRSIEYEVQIATDSAFSEGAVTKSSMTSMAQRLSGGDPTVSTVITTENAIIAVVTAQDSNTNNIPCAGVSRNGQNFTKIDEFGGSGGSGQPVNISIWYLTNPDAGTYNTVADCNGTINECSMTVYRLAGADTADLINNYAGGSANGTPPSADVVTDEDSCYIIGGLVSEGTISGVGAGQDSDSSLTDQSFENTRTTSKAGGAAGTQSLTFSASSQPYAYMAVAINRGAGSIISDKISDTDGGFANPDTPSDLSPFNSGENIQFKPNGGFGYRQALTVDPAQVSGSGTLTNKPILVKHTSVYLKTVSNGGYVENASGHDIVFTDTLGNRLKHEVEKYDAATGEIIAWVRVPSLSGTANTVIYCNFGNSDISTSQQDAEGVWDGNFKGVWHMNQDPSGSAPQVLDSTANGYDMTSAGTMTSGDLVAGKVNKAIDFDGSDDYLTNTAWSSVISGNGARTIEAWFYDTSFSSANWISWGAASGNQLSSMGDFGGNIGYMGYANDHAYSGAGYTSAWHHMVITHDGSTLKVIIDGVERVSDSTSLATSTAANLFFGKFVGGGQFSGLLGEIRISNIARSNDWAITDFNNQNDPSTFYSVGSLEDMRLATGTYYWRVRARTPEGTDAWGSYTAARSFIIATTTPANAGRAAKVTGKASATGSRSAKTTGKDTATASRGAKVTGTAPSGGTEYLIPDGNNSSSGWGAEGGPDYTSVDDPVATPDDGTTKIYTPTANDTFDVTLTDSGLSTETITGVTVVLRVFPLDPVTNTVQAYVKIGGTNYYSSNLNFSDNTQYQNVEYTWTLNPATSAAWTPSELDALIIGIKKIDSNGSRCTQMYAKVDYTGGGTSSNASRGAKVTGKAAATTSRSAKVTGKDTATASRNAKVTGASGANAGRAAKVSGKSTLTGNRSAKVTGKETLTGSRSAKVTGIATAPGSRAAKVTGKSTAATGRNAKVQGIAGSTAGRSAKVTGISTTSSSRGAKVTGKSSLTGSRAAKVSGKSTSTGSRSAKVSGKKSTEEPSPISNGNFEVGTLGAVPTDWSPYNSAGSVTKELTSDSAEGSKAFRLYSATAVDGGIWTETSKRFKLTNGRRYRVSYWYKSDASVTNGKVIVRGATTYMGTTHSGNSGGWQQSSYTFVYGGASTDNVEILVGLGSYGSTSAGEFIVDDIRLEPIDQKRAAKVTGKAAATGSRSAKVTGESASSASRGAKVTGKAAASSSRSAKVTGKSTLEVGRLAKVTGKASETAGRLAKVSGQDTAQSSRGAKITGKDTLQAGRLAKLTGSDSASTSRSAKISGKTQATGSRGAKVTGTAQNIAINVAIETDDILVVIEADEISVAVNENPVIVGIVLDDINCTIDCPGINVEISEPTVV